MKPRLKPVSFPIQFLFGRELTADGVLNIYPRENSTQHPIGGHFYIGENAHPFTGKIEGFQFVNEQKTPQGRPTKAARDIGAMMAYQSFVSGAAQTMPQNKAKSFATGKCLELWDKWPGIKDTPALRQARRKARKELAGKGMALFTYTGIKPNMSDYLCVLLLPGAKWQIANKALHMSGPAWVWCWGNECAEHHQHMAAVASVPSAADSGAVIVVGQ